MQVKLQKFGNSVGTTFPKEVLDKLNLKEGDALNPEFDAVMAAYRQGASQYHNAMKELADG
ncbi:MAG: AbrB/MazE/SpoVT family DNA-binding domain-containing protein [Cyanobacteria bacterium J06626_18]